jgi:hypothetical protein
MDYGKKFFFDLRIKQTQISDEKWKTRLPYLLFFLKLGIMGRNSFRMISNRLVVLNELLQLKACLNEECNCENDLEFLSTKS